MPQSEGRSIYLDISKHHSKRLKNDIVEYSYGKKINIDFFLTPY